MQLPEFETLYQMAELAIGLAGFASVVAFFRHRESGHWSRADADRFNGLVLHAMIAFAFCMLPTLLAVFTSSAETVWRVASTVLGLQILSQIGIVCLLPSSGTATRVALLLGGGAAAALQALNAFGVGFSGEFAPYLAGILWHLLQGGFVFVRLIWVQSVAGED